MKNTWKFPKTPNIPEPWKFPETFLRSEERFYFSGNFPALCNATLKGLVLFPRLFYVQSPRVRCIHYRDHWLSCSDVRLACQHSIRHVCFICYLNIILIPLPCFVKSTLSFINYIFIYWWGFTYYYRNVILMFVHFFSLLLCFIDVNVLIVCQLWVLRWF